ncbi:MAG: CBASS cGAMP-activated phospholipase [Tepidisphaeraceae bacterium]
MAKFRILSLDGGGILGTFSAAFLAELERVLGGRSIGRYFDLIAGTSTGGIIAGALALGEPATRLRDFYRSEGAAIFQRRRPSQKDGLIGRAKLAVKALANHPLDRFGLDTDYLIGTKYGSEALEKSLKTFFCDRTVGMATTARLLIPSVDLTRGDTVMFKTPHLPGRNSRDRILLMRDVIRATTAAPTFFSAATINEGSSYCDGGIWANNPGVAAFVEAMKIREDCRRDCDACFDVDEIFVLSVGTGQISAYLSPPDDKAGVAYWLGHLTEWSMLAQARGTEHQLKYLLGDRLYRVNFPIPDKPTWQMDSAERIEALLHLGNEAAHANLSSLRSVFFDGPATPYTAFTE